MTHTASIPPSWQDNVRPTERHSVSAWLRPAKAASTRFDQPWTHELADVSLRDGSWREAERKDLWALAGVATAFAVLAVVASLLY